VWHVVFPLSAAKSEQGKGTPSEARKKVPFPIARSRFAPGLSPVGAECDTPDGRCRDDGGDFAAREIPRLPAHGIARFKARETPHFTARAGVYFAAQEMGETRHAKRGFVAL
jgi:hypothetical protein